MKKTNRIAAAAFLGSLSLLTAFAGAQPAASQPSTRPAVPKATAENMLHDGNFMVSPPYANAPEMTVKDGVPAGAVNEFSMKSEDCKFYPGIARGRQGVAPYVRQGAVYIPKQYVAGTPAPFIVVQDGMSYVKGMTPILDNLINEKKLPVMIAIFLNPGPGDGPGSERGLEYDTISDKYTQFIETEVLTKLAKDNNLTFTTDPAGRATMGGSSGAACAFTMAWFHPELYSKVLSYSGTYVNQQSPVNPESPHGAWEYHENFIPKSPAKPIRIWMQVADKDNGWNRDEASLHNWVLANDRMADALKAKNYHYRYTYSEAAKHVDRNVVNQTLGQALLYLWQGYPIK